MKRTLVLFMAILLLVMCGCSAPVDETLPATVPTDAPTNPPTNPPTTPPTDAPTDPPTEPPTEAPTEPPVLYRNPLTGEPIDELITDRPVCVVFNNSRAAMPQHGVGQADILYETLIEGETRCMGVFYNFSAATQPLGSIRSARRDFIRLAMGYDAIYVHGGQSSGEYGAKEYLAATGWDHIDGVHGSGSGNYYYRTRQDSYALEHTLFINPDKAIAYAKKMNCTMSRDESVDFGWEFSDEISLAGTTANKVTVWFNLSKTHSTQWHKYTTMNYNDTTGLYEAYQHGANYIDGNTGETLSFRNVLILHMNMKTLDNTLMKIDVVGSGKGYFACNGQIIPIAWSRSSEYDNYVYTYEDGTPLTLGVGKTYVALIPNNGHVEVE